jgi:hypothetical protein
MVYDLLSFLRSPPLLEAGNGGLNKKNSLISIKLLLSYNQKTIQQKLENMNCQQNLDVSKIYN